MGREGQQIFPFHLGDINLPTPANVVDAMNRAIADGKTGYCAAAGIAPLREALADDVGDAPRDQLRPGQHRRAARRQAGDRQVPPGRDEPRRRRAVPEPRAIPIYESQVEYFGGVGQPYRYNQTATGFAIDLDHLRSQITPATKVLIYNNLQNPLGCESSLDEMQVARRAGDPARPVGAQRRGLLRDALLGHQHVDRLASRNARAHGHPLHLLEEVRDDRLASRARRSAPMS